MNKALIDMAADLREIESQFDHSDEKTKECVEVDDILRSKF